MTDDIFTRKIDLRYFVALVDQAEASLAGQQRAAMVGWLLASGEKLSTRDIAEICRFTTRAARDLVRLIEAVLPIRRNEAGEWEAVEPEVD